MKFLHHCFISCAVYSCYINGTTNALSFRESAAIPAISSHLRRNLQDGLIDNFCTGDGFIAGIVCSLLETLGIYEPPSAAPTPFVIIDQTASICDIHDKSYTSFRRGESIIGVQDQSNVGLSVSLSMEGTRLAVGENGGMKVYDFFTTDPEEAPGWVDISNGTSSADFSSYIVSVSLSSDGNHLVVGQQQSIGKRALGSVEVYSRVDNSNWIKNGQTLPGDEDDGFGRSVDISDDGTLIAVGAPFASYVSVYSLEGFFWELQFFEEKGNFGWSVALSTNGKILAIGTPTPEVNSRGAVHVFEIGPNTLIQEIIGDTVGDEFGYSVALAVDGLRLVIGAPGADYVKIFNFNTESFVELDEVELKPDVINSRFGHSVAVSRNSARVAVGAPNYDVNGENAGATFLFNVICGNSSLVEVIDGTSRTNEAGRSVSLSETGSILAMGEIFSDGNTSVNSGQVQVFEFLETE